MLLVQLQLNVIKISLCIINQINMISSNFDNYVQFIGLQGSQNRSYVLLTNNTYNYWLFIKKKMITQLSQFYTVDKALLL